MSIFERKIERIADECLFVHFGPLSFDLDAHGFKWPMIHKRMDPTSASEGIEYEGAAI